MRDFHLFCTYIHTLLLGFYINGQIFFFFHIFCIFRLQYLKKKKFWPYPSLTADIMWTAFNEPFAQYDSCIIDSEDHTVISTEFKQCLWVDIKSTPTLWTLKRIKKTLLALTWFSHSGSSVRVGTMVGGRRLKRGLWRGGEGEMSVRTIPLLESSINHSFLDYTPISPAIYAWHLFSGCPFREWPVLVGPGHEQEITYYKTAQ